ncbi:potassium channel family protein [Methanocaldococcus indicus]|uniref:potassium channel family protein n=1 Tax=Methanocaldococcus indicus TaxID=213231 RepID=UPI003C6D09DB
MYIIIAGLGRVGFTLAKSLEKRGHDLVLIDIDKERCKLASMEIDCIVINGDCRKSKVLEDAGIEEADIYIAVTGREEINILSALLAKNYGVNKILARISEIEHKDILEKLNILTISPELVAASYIEKMIERPGVLELFVIGKGEAEILEFVIPESCKVANKKIKELNPEDYLIIAIYENGNLEIPKGDTVLKVGQKVLVLAKKESINKVKELFSLD